MFSEFSDLIMADNHENGGNKSVEIDILVGLDYYKKLT